MKPTALTLRGRTYKIKQARHHGTARTPWAVYEVQVGADWLVLDFLTATEAIGAAKQLQSLGATVHVE